MNYRFHPEVEAGILSSASYYDAHAHGKGIEFLKDVDFTIKLILKKLKLGRTLFMTESLKDNRAKAVKKAFDLLSRRDHSRNELKTKLFSRKFTADIVEYALNECERLGFINDHNFAQRYVEELQANGYGIFRLREKLYRKGVDKAVIEATLASLDSDAELESAREAMEKKLRQLRRETDEQKKRQKLYRYLVSRGFSSSTVHEILNTESF